MEEKTKIVICHYGPQKLLIDCVKAISHFYDNIPIVIQDDNENTPRLGHGRQLDNFFRNCDCKYAITMDNDIRLLREGIFEEMFKLMDEKTYAVGEAAGHEIFYIHPKLALWRVEPIVSNNLSFQDAMIYDFVTERWFEVPTGAYVGYQLFGKYGYVGKNFNVLSYAHHLSQKV